MPIEGNLFCLLIELWHLKRIDAPHQPFSSLTNPFQYVDRFFFLVGVPSTPLL